MPSFFGVNKPEVPKLFSEDVLLILFLCFKSFVVHGILIESIYYITDCHDDDMSFPIQICDLWMDWMDGMDG